RRPGKSLTGAVALREDERRSQARFGQLRVACDQINGSDRGAAEVAGNHPPEDAGVGEQFELPRGPPTCGVEIAAPLGEFPQHIGEVRGGGHVNWQTRINAASVEAAVKT